MSSCSRAIYQECEISLRVDLRLAIPRCARNIPHICEMLELRSLIPLVPDEYDSVILNAHLFTSFLSSLQERLLRRQCLGTGVLQLECEFVGCVPWICGRENPACPLCSPCYRRCIDAIGSEECQHISFLPIPECFQTFAEVESGAADLGISVGPVRVWVDVDHCTTRY
jgi:hypothetical protein